MPVVLAASSCLGSGSSEQAVVEPDNSASTTSTADGAAGASPSAATGGEPQALGVIAEALEPPVVVRVNHPPRLRDVDFVGSKLACGPTLEVCAEADDEDGDPLGLTLGAPRECTAYAKAAVGRAPERNGPSGIEQCWKLTCHTVGKVELDLQVHDYVDDGGGGLTPIERLLSSGGRSHGELRFFAYFDGTLFWPDLDEDGQGDRAAQPVLRCNPQDAPDGHVANGDDCNDADPAIRQGTAERCGDGIDNNCDGLREEKCILGRSLVARKGQ